MFGAIYPVGKEPAVKVEAELAGFPPTGSASSNEAKRRLATKNGQSFRNM